MANEYPHLQRYSFFGAELPEWASDAVHTEVEVRLGFADRLRVLLFGRFGMCVVAYTENLIGRTVGESVFVAPRRRFWRRKRMVYVVTQGQEGDNSEEGKA